MLKRNVGRELAVHLLYQFDLRSVREDELLPLRELCFARCCEGNYYLFEESETLPKKQDFDFVRRLLDVSIRELDSIDDVIASALRAWSIERMPMLERAILRVALAEILYLDTPTSVAIDEALRLLEKLSLPSSKSYINGILGRVVRELSLEKKGRETESETETEKLGEN